MIKKVLTSDGHLMPITKALISDLAGEEVDDDFVYDVQDYSDSISVASIDTLRTIIFTLLEEND